MRKKIEWKLEKLDDHTYRAKVIGGWIVTKAIFHPKGGVTESMVFVADRDHEWEIAIPFDPRDPGKVRPKVNPDDFASPAK